MERHSLRGVEAAVAGEAAEELAAAQEVVRPELELVPAERVQPARARAVAVQVRREPEHPYPRAQQGVAPAPAARKPVIPAQMTLIDRVHANTLHPNTLHANRFAGTQADGNDACGGRGPCRRMNCMSALGCSARHL